MIDIHTAEAGNTNDINIWREWVWGQSPQYWHLITLSISQHQHVSVLYQHLTQISLSSDIIVLDILSSYVRHKKQISCPVSVSRKQSFKFEQSLVRANFPRRLPVLCHKWKCPTPTLTSPVNLHRGLTALMDRAQSCGPDGTLPQDISQGLGRHCTA